MTVPADGWKPLGAVSPQSLVDARLQCHHALQVATRITRAYLPAQSDDSHTNFGWDAGSSLLSHPIASSGGEFQAGLQMPELALEIAGQSLTLDGLTLRDALEWASGELRRRGLDPAGIERPLHFEIPEHGVGAGGRFSWHGREAAFEELTRYYANAAEALEAVREQWSGSPVRCWPHHFDIATLIDRGGGRSVGAGLSPGDPQYPEPYFYVNVWPYPSKEALTALPAGHWNTEGWTGAVLTATQLLPGQAAILDRFLNAAINCLIQVTKE